jgi:hypothetical protein
MIGIGDASASYDKRTVSNCTISSLFVLTSM